jgi:predicted nucleic acid-binding protein
LWQLTSFQVNSTRAGGRDTPHADALQDLVTAGHIEIVPLDDTGWQHFEMLVFGHAWETLDDGEAATIAYVTERGAVAIIDERKATRICAERFPDLGVITTVDVLLHPKVRLKLGERAFADAIFAALRDARMAVSPRHFDEVVRLIGPERAGQCPEFAEGLEGFSSKIHGP